MVGFGGLPLPSIRGGTPSCLVAGDKSGTSPARFYKRLIEKADGRYKAHLKRMG